MSNTSPFLIELANILSEMPPGVYFDNSADEKSVNFQASNLAELKKIIPFFPGTTWKKHFEKVLGWWEYKTEWKGWKIKIYACREAPATCKAITEKQLVKTKVPVQWKEVEEEKEVIVGWDCD